MRTSDLIRLALKNLKGGWAVLPALGIAVAAFCLCFAGAVNMKVQQEKSQPYEIIVSSESQRKLSENDVFEISRIEGVTAATAVLEVSVTVAAGEYSAKLTLTGVDAGYLEGSFLTGGAFPNDTVMPYIVLNEAACKQFKRKEDQNIWQDEPKDEPEDDLPLIDWLGESFSLQTDEATKAITSKVCGILAANEEAQKEPQPVAYISVASAKALLLATGQSADSAAIRARVENIGCAQDVSKKIAELGLVVSNSAAELQAGWNVEQAEMSYLIVTGAFCLICSAALLIAWRKISLLEQKDAWDALNWLGIKRREMGALFLVQALTISLAGVATGLIISLSLPSFLSTGTYETIFLLPVPFEAEIVSALICLAGGVAPVLIVNRKITVF